MIQEEHLPVDRLAKVVHRLLPANSLFAGHGRPQRGAGRPTQIQVVTLVHVYMAARASLFDVWVQYEAVAGVLQQAHFIRMSDPRSDTTLLLGNVYQFQASQPERQAAMLELISRVILRWSDHADLVMICRDFNASCRPHVDISGAKSLKWFAPFRWRPARTFPCRGETWPRTWRVTAWVPFLHGPNPAPVSKIKQENSMIILGRYYIW
jgi:hypothetical protein